MEHQTLDNRVQDELNEESSNGSQSVQNGNKAHKSVAHSCRTQAVLAFVGEFYFGLKFH